MSFQQDDAGVQRKQHVPNSASFVVFEVVSGLRTPVDFLRKKCP